MLLSSWLRSLSSARGYSWKELNRSPARRRRLQSPINTRPELLERRLLLSKPAPPPPAPTDPQFGWAFAAGAAGSDGANGLATDSGGNVYVASHFGQTVDFDPGPGVAPLTSTGGDSLGLNVAIAKYTPSESLAWVKQITGTSYQSDARIDSFSGTVAVNGNPQSGSTVTFGADSNPPNAQSLTSSNGRWSYVARYDETTGNLVDARAFATVGTGSIFARVAFDGAGNIYAYGNLTGTADFDLINGGHTLTSAGGTQDFFVAKYDNAWNLQWASLVGGSAGSESGSLAVDANGVYLAGQFSGTVDFDPGAGVATLTASGRNDVFVERLTTTGSFVWAKRIGGTGDAVPYDDDGARGIAVDSSGNIDVTGLYSMQPVYKNGKFTGKYTGVDFDPGAGTYTLSTSGGTHGNFVLQLDPNGIFRWAVNGGGWGLYTVDSASSIYAGVTVGPVVQSTDTVAKYTNAGSQVWSVTSGNIQALSVDSAGNVDSAGSFAGTVDFDPTTATYNLSSNSDSNDIFVAKWTQSGFAAAQTSAAPTNTTSSSTATSPSSTSLSPSLISTDSGSTSASSDSTTSDSSTTTSSSTTTLSSSGTSGSTDASSTDAVFTSLSDPLAQAL